jgi:hypothetical protein
MWYRRMHLRAENRTYLWWRGGNWWPAFARHTPGGRWSVARNLLHIKDQRPYVKLHGDGEATIHIAYTEGNPGSFANSVYYLRYTRTRSSTRTGHAWRGCATCPSRRRAAGGSTTRAVAYAGGCVMARVP